MSETVTYKQNELNLLISAKHKYGYNYEVFIENMKLTSRDTELLIELLSYQTTVPIEDQMWIEHNEKGTIFKFYYPFIFDNDISPEDFSLDWLFDKCKKIGIAINVALDFLQPYKNIINCDGQIMNLEMMINHYDEEIRKNIDSSIPEWKKI